jgi:hypothetical protein
MHYQNLKLINGDVEKGDFEVIGTKTSFVYDHLTRAYYPITSVVKIWTPIDIEEPK